MTKSPQVASWRLPLRVQTICRLSANSTRNSRPKSATTRPSMTTCCSFSRRVGKESELEQGVQLGRADEVVLREAVDRVRDVRDAALVVPDEHVRVVILAVRDPRGGVHEGHGLEVVLEFVRLGDGLAIEGPALQPLEHRA